MGFSRGPQPCSEEPLVAVLQAFPHGCILLRDSLAASGHFLLPWITSASLAQGHKVVFIAAAYSPAKHRAALRKIGAPGMTAAGAAPAQASSSPIAFVSPVQQQQQQQQQGTSVDNSSSPSISNLPRLQQLYQQVEAAARQLLSQQQQQQQQQPSPQQHLTVVVDSLAVLSCLVCDEQQVAALLQQLAALGEVLQVPLRLVMLASGDVAADSQLVAATAARAHVLLDVAPLEGRTAALDGSVTVAVRRACRTLAGQQHQQRRFEREVAGMAGGVLPGWLCPGSSSVWFFRAGDVATRWLPEVHGKELIV